MAIPRVLVLCTGNSARSQMAEGLIRAYLGNQVEVHSAGLTPKGVNPYAIRVMQEIGLDISQHQSKNVQQYRGQAFDYLITVCSHAEENCPTFPAVRHRLHWPFEDPAAYEGTPAEVLAKFREVRDQIDQKVRAWDIAESNRNDG